MIHEYEQCGFRSFVFVTSLKEAVNRAVGLAKKGESVLFSPGASSFGKFVNEFDRGAKFVREVRRIR
jgi:UDP-N-acetylmuramoylalanine--D-glutamate ligase